MLTRGSFIEIAFYNLLLSGLCRPKLIENESFLRSSRYLKSFENETPTQFTTSALPVDAADSNPLQFDAPTTVDVPTTDSMTTTMPTIDSNESTKKPQKITRKIDNINELRQQQHFFYTKQMNASNFHLNRTSKYYINYRQAYGIRYDPNKIRRSFNYVTNDTEDEPDGDDADGLNNENVIVANDIVTTHSTEPSEKHVLVVTNEATPQTTTEPATTDAGGSLSFETTEMSTELNDRDVQPAQHDNSNVSDNFPHGSLNGTNALDGNNSTTNIMKPTRIEAALQFINARVKDFFKNSLVARGSAGTTQVVNRSNTTTGSGQRFLNLFDVIKFDNIPCASQLAPLTPLNGTCYHQFECNQLGGVAVDECAGGFGVCCVFQFGCGGVTRQNTSYFKSPDFPAATTARLICTFTIELWPGVNQVLIEFIFFELKPPIDGSCSDDQFIVSGQSANSPIPILCGINSGMHVYVDVESSVERKLYLSVLAATVAARAFNIRVSQLQINVAPQSCLQYFTEPSGYVQTFNYADEAEIVETRTPSYFNNLNYAICIRRVPEYCVTTYSNEATGTEMLFQLTNVDQDGLSIIPLGQAGAEIYNCADDFIAFNGIRLCGEKFNDASITEDFTINAPVTDYSAGPILIPVRSNSAVVGRGFKLYYAQQPCQIE